MSKSVKPITARQAGELARLLEERGISGDVFQTRLVQGIEELRRWLNGTSLPNCYQITVDYDQPLDQAIKVGHYDWHNDDITSEHFPSERSGKFEMETDLVHFGHDISTDNALAELDKRGFRPADLHELLAFGAKYPEVQREFPVVGLGSVWQGPDGSRLCPYLRRDGAERGLGLGWLGVGWGGYSRFAAVRK
ncbi:MAG: hypothetical protein M1338_03460 [Patescibacteria group bacterium]|nr:hypothetical protein [Patescibacteria group bacterium]